MKQEKFLKEFTLLLKNFIFAHFKGYQIFQNSLLKLTYIVYRAFLYFHFNKCKNF